MVGCAFVSTVPFYRITVTGKLSVGSYASVAPPCLRELLGPSGRKEVTAGRPAALCEIPRHEFFWCVGARFSSEGTVRGPLEEILHVILIADPVVEYFKIRERRVGASFRGEVCRCGRRQYRWRGTSRVRHTVSENPFSSTVLVDEASANLIAEHSKEADSSGQEFAVTDDVRCCWL